MKHICIINEESRAGAYGIGTYIGQIIHYLKEKENIILHIIILSSKEPVCKITQENNCYFYHIPEIKTPTPETKRVYFRNAWYIMADYLKEILQKQLIFHFNYFTHEPILELARNYYPESRIILTIHYMNWSFLLKGDIYRLKEILHKDRDLLTDHIEQNVIASYEMEKKVFQWTDHIICLTQYTKDLLHTYHHLPEEKVSLIRNALQDEAVFPTERIKAKLKKQLFIEEEKIILFVGRIEEGKGVDILIDAFKIVLKKERNCRLILVGQGQMGACLQKSDNLWSKITLTGHIDKKRVYDFYQVADIGVLPSLHEQCSFVAIEMMMFALPLIISPALGLTEMLKVDDEDAKKNKKRNSFSPDSLAGQIKKILYQPDQKKKLSREIYEKKFSELILYKNLNQIYDI